LHEGVYMIDTHGLTKSVKVKTDVPLDARFSRNTWWISLFK